MILSQLSAHNLRHTYLRGIQLGAAWQGPSADAALESILLTWLAFAESQMNVQFQAYRVVTAPPPTLVAGVDYDALAPLIAFVPLQGQETVYTVIPSYHDVQALMQVRLVQNAVYVPLDVTQIVLSRQDDKIRIPASLVPDETGAQAWALDYTIGLGQLPLEIAEWVSLSAAIEVLGMANSADDVSGGLASEKQVQDGIEEQVAYAGAGREGPYGPTLQQFRQLRDEIDLPKLRFRYQYNKRPY